MSVYNRHSSDRDRSSSNGKRIYRGYDISPQPSDYDMKRYRRDDNGRNYEGGSGRDNNESRGHGREINHRERTCDKDGHDNQIQDWKCLECCMWNHSKDRRCGRCGVSSPLIDPKSSSSVAGTGDETFQMDNDKVDEFGRSVALKVEAEKKGLGKKKIWPPCFETNGSSFVFDSRSGMFYESTSNFYYDPKSKLYYGIEQCAYHSYDPKTRRFEEIQKVENTQNNESLNPDPILETVKAGSARNKNVISIKLKTKTLDSTNAAKNSNTVVSKTDVVVPVKPRALKVHSVDINKWEDRQFELKEVNATTDQVTTTTKVEPICFLCRKKFPSLAKLEYHEKASDLHKENLAKKAEKEDSEKWSTSYVDRAQQRRDLYGSDAIGVRALEEHEGVSADSQGLVNDEDARYTGTNLSRTFNPDHALGETNIGNQMMQKLGWKGGEGLGKIDEASITEEYDEVPYSKSLPSNTLKQDWERIEALAANGGKIKRSTGGIGMFRN